jgi:hypothetical protein
LREGARAFPPQLGERASFWGRQASGASAPDVHIHVGRLVVDSAVANAGGLNRQAFAQQVEIALRHRLAADRGGDLRSLAGAIADALWSRIAADPAGR